MRRVVVTGIGVISPLGNSPDTLFHNLMNGTSGIRPVTVNGPNGSYTNIAGTAAAFDPSQHFTPQQIGNLDRATQFALVAAAAAASDAGLELSDTQDSRAGVSIGTSMGAANGLEEAYTQVLTRDPDRLKPLTILTVMSNAPAAHIALQHRLAGPNLTYSCACSSSAVAIGEAYRQIKHGYADRMFAGGTEAIITFGFFKAWAALRVLARIDKENPGTSCRPFSADRTGLVLGEGAAIVMLEERNRALDRGAKIYAELTGYGSSNDPTHITKPSVEGQSRAMALALADAELSPPSIGYINAHGTATTLNDATETQAIKNIFGDSARQAAVSSTKSMHGHLLGAAGALELAITTLAVHRKAIPPTAHLHAPDPQCDLDYVPHHGRECKTLRNAMSNSFAFGGTNAVLIVSEANGK